MIITTASFSCLAETGPKDNQLCRFVYRFGTIFIDDDPRLVTEDSFTVIVDPVAVFVSPFNDIWGIEGSKSPTAEDATSGVGLSNTTIVCFHIKCNNTENTETRNLS